MKAPCETQACAPTVGAIVVAAGESRRMKGVDKIFYDLNGAPLVWHSVSTLLSHHSIKEVVLVTSETNVAAAKAMVATRHGDSVKVFAGGKRRQDSVRLGLEKLGKCDYVMIHDGARPFISAQLIDRGISVARETGAAIAAVPVTDTIKHSDDEGVVTHTVPRDGLWSVQTPQIFKTSLLVEAHRRVSGSVTDDASMVESIGHSVHLFAGSHYNIKVTTPEDLVLAQAICSLDMPPAGKNSA